MEGRTERERGEARKWGNQTPYAELRSHRTVAFELVVFTCYSQSVSRV